MLYILAFFLNFSLQIIYNQDLTYVVQCAYASLSFTFSILSFEAAIVLSLIKGV